jgi:hypothetical protein
MMKRDAEDCEMRRRAIMGICLLLLGLWQKPWQAAPELLSGEWVGGFRLKQQWVFVKACFKADGASLKVVIEMPLEGVSAQPQTIISQDASRVRFEVPENDGRISFDGRVKDGVISGEVEHGGQRGAFELARVVKLDARNFGEFVGAYQLGPHRTILIAMTEAGLAYQDAALGNVGLLQPLSPTSFFSGRSLLTDFPVEVKITFVKNEFGAVTGLIYQPRGLPARNAPRV